MKPFMIRGAFLAAVTLHLALFAYPAAADCPKKRATASVASSTTTFPCQGEDGGVMQCVTIVHTYTWSCGDASEDTNCVDDPNAVLQDIYRERCINGTCVPQPVVVTMTGPGKKTVPC